LTVEGKARASEEIRRIACGGGTDPTWVLHYLATRSLTNCGLLFFSDGEFAPLTTQRPDCRMTAFGISGWPFPPNAPIRALADPIHVPPDFDPRAIRIPFFDPRSKDQFFEIGTYTALSMKHVLPRAGALEVPGAPLDGSATTYLKPDSELVAVRAKLTDPVLAYRESGAGYVGELTTTLPDAWFARDDDRRPIRQWISAILPLTDERRYVFSVTQAGSELDLEVALSPRAGRLPDVEHLDARVELRDGPPLTMSFRRDEAIPATFHGRLAIPTSGSPSRATLVLQESGADALQRPQRVPILLPAMDEVEGARRPESYSAGMNSALLRRIAAVGGGGYDALDGMGSGERATTTPPTPLWPLLAALAAGCHVLAIFLRRIDP
jgi:hypothetical protein